MGWRHCVHSGSNSLGHGADSKRLPLCFSFSLSPSSPLLSAPPLSLFSTHWPLHHHLRTHVVAERARIHANRMPGESSSCLVMSQMPTCPCENRRHGRGSSEGGEHEQGGTP